MQTTRVNAACELEQLSALRSIADDAHSSFLLSVVARSRVPYSITQSVYDPADFIIIDLLC